MSTHPDSCSCAVSPAPAQIEPVRLEAVRFEAVRFEAVLRELAPTGPLVAADLLDERVEGQAGKDLGWAISQDVISVDAVTSAVLLDGGR